MVCSDGPPQNGIEWFKRREMNVPNLLYKNESRLVNLNFIGFNFVSELSGRATDSRTGMSSIAARRRRHLEDEPGQMWIPGLGENKPRPRKTLLYKICNYIVNYNIISKALVVF